MLKLKVDSIPQVLKNRNHWVGFTVTAEGKKLPISPTTQKGASVADPTTWGTFEQAYSLVNSGKCSAVGYAITADDNLIFLDLDCHTDGCGSDEEKAKLTALYKSLCNSASLIESYQETSLSGNGVHLLAFGKLDKELKQGKSPIAPIEFYTDKRFVIVTGHALNDYDISSDDRVAETLKNMQKQFFKKKSELTVTNDSSKFIPATIDISYADEQVLNIALKDDTFNLLWNNRWQEVLDESGSQKYTQQHFADYALICKLIFYTGNCPNQVDKLFRQSPCYQAYGKNGKWVKYDSDIRNDIKTASENCSVVYDPNYRSANNPSVWVADYKKIYDELTAEDDCLILDPKLRGLLLNYISTYSKGKKINYIPYLFRYDRNVNGGAIIAKSVFGDNLKYSTQNSSFYLWESKKYTNYGDADMLIHPITEVLAMVEHSVFHWCITNAENYKTKDSTERATFENKALERFYEAKKFVSVKLAQDILKKYKGMDVYNDIAAYYDTPYINMQNGVLDINSRELFEHDTMYNQSKIAGCDYIKGADCSEFKAMLKRLMPIEADRRELQKAFGLCLAKEQLPAKKVLMLLVGPKDTGKTTVLNTIVEVLGEYGTAVDNSLLMKNNREKSRGPEMYDFRETLMITASETSENDRLDAGKVKALTGETMQSVRNNYATKMDKFRMIGLIFIDSNFKPYIDPKDTAMWGRIRLFPFVCPVTQKDPDLKRKLAAEKSGIFNWLLEGLDMVLEEKEIYETPAMLDFKEQYMQEMDVTQQFISDCCIKSEDKHCRILTSTLYTAYKNWCKDNGFHDSVRNKFYEEIMKYFEKKKSGSEFFVGINFTELGALYSHMLEKTPQQFAKDKRKVLEKAVPTDLPYTVLRQVHFDRSKKWFIDNIVPQQDLIFMYDRYSDYVGWCVEQALIPLKVDDFKAKVYFIKKNLTTPDVIKKANTVWAN